MSSFYAGDSFLVVLARRSSTVDHLKSDGVVVLVSGCPERMLVMNEEAVLLRMDLGPYRHQCCFGPPRSC